MGNLANKLSYLNGTKAMFRSRLNSLGANITLNTTFRNYLTWLDTFYEAALNTMENIVNGETKQKSILTSLNRIPAYDGTITTDGITLTVSNGGKFSINGTAERNFWVKVTNGFDVIYETPQRKWPNGDGWFEEHIANFENGINLVTYRGGGTSSNSNYSACAYHETINNSRYVSPSMPLIGTEYEQKTSYSNRNAREFKFLCFYFESGRTFDNYWVYLQVLDADDNISVWYPYLDAIPASVTNPKEITGKNREQTYTSRDEERTFPVNLGGKNLVRNTLKGTTTTVNGMTFKFNEDGTFIVNGTATELVNVVLCDQTQTDITNKIKGKKVFLSGNPDTFPGQTYLYSTLIMRVGSSGFYPGPPGFPSEAEEIPSNVSTWELAVTFRKGITANNMLFKPMVRLESDTDDTYEPYSDIELYKVNDYTDCVSIHKGKFYVEKQTARIESYNGETITTDYISSVGSLETGATVIYGLSTPTKSEIKESDYYELYNQLMDIAAYETTTEIERKLTF